MRASIEGTSLGQGSAPWHLGASSEGHHWKGATLGCTGSEPAKPPGAPRDAFMALTKSSTQKLLKWIAEVTVIVLVMDCNVCKIF